MPDVAAALARAPDPRCPACGGTRSRVRWQLGDRLFRTTDDRFTLYACAACSVTFVWPIPDASRLASYYPEGYWARRPGGQSATAHQWVTERYRRTMLRDHLRFVRGAIAGQHRLGKTTVSVLDVGCGDGLFLDALDHRPCAGLDFSQGAVAACRARGIDAHRGDLQSNAFAGRQFDLVTMFHLLEHVSPAGPTLQSARRLLGPGGELIVQVPNAASLQARLLGRYWAGYDVPRHLITYTTDTLCATLTRNRFDVVEISHRSIRDNPTTLANSVAPGLYPPVRVARGLARGRLRPWVADAIYLGLTLACLPPTAIESVFGIGAAVTVRARPAR